MIFKLNITREGKLGKKAEQKSFQESQENPETKRQTFFFLNFIFFFISLSQEEKTLSTLDLRQSMSTLYSNLELLY